MQIGITAGVTHGRPHGPASYWLIVGGEGARKTLTLHSGLRGEILPVFGSEEDAGVFLMPLGAFGGGFAARPIAAEDLASLLRGPLSSVGTVALDPAPGMDTAATLDLVSTDRQSFAEDLTDGRVTAGAPRSAKGSGSGARLSLLVLAVLALMLAAPATARAQDAPATEVGSESELRAAWADPLETSIKLTKDIHLNECGTGDPIRESAPAVGP